MGDILFEKSGLMKFKQYSLVEVAPWIYTGYHKPFNLPTEVCVSEPRFVVPEQGRVWHTVFEYGRQRNGEEIPRVWCVEIFEDNGDDGHTSMRLESFVFFDSKDWEELENGEPKLNWRGEVVKWHIADLVKEKVRNEEAREEAIRREKLRAEGKDPWTREEKPKVDPSDNTIAGLLVRLKATEDAHREENETLRADFWRLKEKFRRFYARVKDEIEDTDKPFLKFLMENNDPEKWGEEE